jgi:plastocyanin
MLESGSPSSSWPVEGESPDRPPNTGPRPGDILVIRLRLFSSMIGCGLLLAAVVQPAAAQEWANLKIRLVYDAPVAPVPEKIDGSRDAFCGNLNIVSESMLVNPENMGIQNAVIYVDARRSRITAKDIHPDLAKAPSEPVLLDNKDCIFVPHVFLARPGQSIRVTNSDDTGHNANFSFFNNAAVNVQVPPGGSKDIPLTAEEPAPIPVECNIHPWMRGYAVVVDHPYAGISDENGVLVIEGLPAGKKLEMRIWHENQAGAISELTINGKSESWARGRFTMELKPGDNDLGEAKIAPKLFRN